MKIIEVKEELKEPIEKIMLSMDQARSGILLLTRERYGLHKELWETIHSEIPETEGKYCHLDTEKMQIIVFNRESGRKRTYDRDDDILASVAGKTAALELRLSKLEKEMEDKE